MSRFMRSLCQEEREAYVKITAKPMSRRMRSRCQDYREAYVKKNGKPMSRYLEVEPESA